MLSFADIDVSKISFSEIMQLKNGGKMVYINYNKEPLYFITPTMNSPFGISNYEGSGKLSIQLSLTEDPEHQAVLTKIREIEQVVINKAFESSAAWFKKSFDKREIVSEFFSSAVYQGQDGKYAPTLKFQITNDTEAFLNKKEQIQVNEQTIVRRSNVAVIGRIASVYVIGSNKFGITYKAEQLKVALPKTVTKPMFVFDEEDVDVEVVAENA